MFEAEKVCEESFNLMKVVFIPIAHQSLLKICKVRLHADYDLMEENHSSLDKENELNDNLPMVNHMR